MQTQTGSPVRPLQRVIRVFVSSTFKDMFEEREQLVKHVFPRLRKVCEQRQVSWGEVDLRWGITDEKRAEGKVLPICLAEIGECRPFFIGILGERYGWIPEEIPAELISQEPWLREHVTYSVTELEILHGVLRNPEMARHAFFYFRDPAYVETLPESQKTHFTEGPSPDEISKLGEQEANRRAGERRKKLLALKDKIRASGFPVRENYRGPKELGELVFSDLVGVINKLYPEGSEPGRLEREAMGHEIFALSRSRVYVGQRNHFDRLDAHVAGSGPPSVIVGGAGVGKSALLANWTLRFREERPGVFVVMHFLGATAQSADWKAMLVRIMGELKARFSIQEEIPESPDGLRSAFASWLHMAAASGKTVLVIDALDKLEDTEGAPDLTWLPPIIPENIRLILSTLPGRPLAEIERRGWKKVRVEPPEVEERRVVIREYLKQYTKELSPPFEEKIVSSPPAANPLYLRTLLEELRLYGDHWTLGRRIDHYLAAPNAPELFGKVLERYEEDYEEGRPSLVKDAMSFLWASRFGLSESELLELLGSNGAPLPASFWSPFRLAAEQSLINRSGLLVFSHDYLKQAVCKRYLAEEALQQAAHLSLAGYFQTRPLESRSVDELPWQLSRGRAWPRVYSLLTDLEFFEAAWKANEFDVKAYWNDLETSSSFRMLDGYRGVLERPENHISVAWEIARLLAHTGHPAESLRLRGFLVGHYRKTGNKSMLCAALINQANILFQQGQIEKALALDVEAEQISIKLGSKADLAVSLGNQALALKVLGRLDEALLLHKKEELVHRELQAKRNLAECLVNQANILHTRGDLEEALKLAREAERCFRELGHLSGLASCLDNQGLIHADSGNLQEALRLHREAEQTFRGLGDKQGLATSLANQAKTLSQLQDFERALALSAEAKYLLRGLGHVRGVSAVIGLEAVIFLDRKQIDRAAASYQEQERLCREVGDIERLAVSLAGQAEIAHQRGDLASALRFYRETQRIYEQLGNKLKLSSCLFKQALACEALGRREDALVCYKEHEQLCRETGDKRGLAMSLLNHAIILGSRNDLAGAMMMLEEQEALCRELDDVPLLAMSLANQAWILAVRNKAGAALELIREAHQLAVKGGNPPLVSLVRSTYNKILARQS